jgi:hypothetical protein
MRLRDHIDSTDELLAETPSGLRNGVALHLQDATATLDRARQRCSL